ncbi:MAG: thioredoxin-like domain-containing protein [Erysipelotrichales bacterium]|nr:thioredoxin-like domain-containing protein [Erysipelotrichales bacterium]
MKKSMLAPLFFIMTILFFGCFSNKKELTKTLRFQIDGIAPDSLKANFYGNFNQTIFFDKQNNTDWKISVPDSIYDDYESLILQALLPNNGWTEIMLVDSPKFVKYNVTNVLFFTDKNPSIIKAKFHSLIDNNILVMTTSYMDTEYANGKKTADLLSKMRRDEISKDKTVDTIFEYVRASPNSLALIKHVDSFLFNEINLDTYKRLYLLFSDKMRTTSYGQSFKKYLDDREAYESSNRIQVFNLQRCDTKEIEPFIRDDGKYKLIIFSSVGCAPCHEAIPIYKKIYQDLSDKLDMLYISVDNKEQSDQWNKVLEKYEIPWRSYFSYGIKGGILQKYMLRAVPSSFLVMPDMTFEKIDIRDQKNKDKLYELLEYNNK